MKTHKVLFLALFVSASLAVSVEAGDRHGNNGRSQSRSFSSGSSGRTIGPSAHFSSMRARSMPAFRQRSSFSSSRNVGSFSQRRFTPGTFNRSNRFARSGNNRNLGTLQGTGGNRTAQFGTGGRNRTIGNTSPGHNHVFAQRTASWNRNWDRRQDHWWNGHRCRWVNNSWFIFDIGFIPWFGWPYYDYYAYDYYPPVYPYGYGYGYDSGAYYGSNYYDQPAEYDQGGYNYNDQSNYDQSNSNNSYDQGRNGLGSNQRATVADVQDQLTRAGYYHGKIDGVLGPETRHALVRYQSNKGLRMTGSLTTETQQSLGLAGQGGDQITDQ